MLHAPVRDSFSPLGSSVSLDEKLVRKTSATSVMQSSVELRIFVLSL